jgi:hypothetical protein
MKRVWGILISAACVIALAAPIAGAQSKLEGVWKVSEETTTGPNAHTTSNPQPGLFVFTKKYVSTIGIAGDKPRASLSQNATDAERVAAYRPLQAWTGTYEVKNGGFIVHVAVSYNPNDMGAGAILRWVFKLDHNSLLLDYKGNQNGPAANSLRLKLVRVE